eukprot:CAMPEP_0173350104 /NCGR_PEP_ID=MMETSP1144-20121109/14690_1 /TAXON_ID=483371 /ORGANISM="non described non described, Strain CCMP2298" /LENGTH=713 /DNA_ID=CAMNT_0014297997 /DNA_START=184 /DNA_END=2321 /DNA_ORIENTATION=+
MTSSTSSAGDSGAPSGSLLLSVPNPKRSVPVNFLNIINEDSYATFGDYESLSPPPPHSSLSNSGGSGFARMGSSRTDANDAATPDVFEFYNNSNNNSKSEFLADDSALASLVYESDAAVGELDLQQLVSRSHSVTPVGRGTSPLPMGTGGSQLLHLGADPSGASTSSLHTGMSSHIPLLPIPTRAMPQPRWSQGYSSSSNSVDDITSFHTSAVGGSSLNRPFSTPAQPSGFPASTFMNSVFENSMPELADDYSSMLLDSYEKTISREPTPSLQSPNGSILDLNSGLSGNHDLNVGAARGLGDEHNFLGSLLRASGGAASAPPLMSYYHRDMGGMGGPRMGNAHEYPGAFGGGPAAGMGIGAGREHQSSPFGKGGSPSLPGEQESVETTVLRTCQEILSGAADGSLKAVELANTLRARVGTDALGRIRERWGGLLALLEKQSSLFRVDRIPKNDKVTLISSDGGPAGANGGSRISSPVPGGAGFKTFVPGGEGSPMGGLGAGLERLDLKKGNAMGMGGSYESLSPNAGGGAANATRCLHVGNVPANLSEVQLMREFEKFGQLDGLKLVSQRNGTRRFAFVTFHTVDQAITARHCLSKLHPWKSAISFAHREFSQANHAGQGMGQGIHGQTQAQGQEQGWGEDKMTLATIAAAAIEVAGISKDDTETYKLSSEVRQNLGDQRWFAAEKEADLKLARGRRATEDNIANALGQVQAA